MELTSLGVIRRSRKENEWRVPIHPDHFARVPADAADRLIFEEGYGEPFGFSDDELRDRFGGVVPRSVLLAECDGVILPKPVPEDLEELHEGGILWGWPHCVQQAGITRLAVERSLTLLAFEAMYDWNDGVRGSHLFYRNNEMAGYCGVLHSLSLQGVSGRYGPPLRAVVLSFGYVSRGAIHALKGLGVTDISVYTQRPPVAVHHRIGGCRHGQILRGTDGPSLAWMDGVERPLVEALAEADIIVNGILQDTDNPFMYLREGEEERLKPGALIVDVSCDLGMAFPFARPTSFEHPTFRVGEVTYYAVDHTPSYLWRSASWEISRVVVAYLERVMRGPDGWQDDETLRRAVEIRDGQIVNPKILRFQSAGGEVGDA